MDLAVVSSSHSPIEIFTGGLKNHRNGAKMDFRPNRQIGPVCRLGPGGDFVTFWPLELRPENEIATSRLGELVNTLSDIMNAVLGSEFNPATAGDGDANMSGRKIGQILFPVDAVRPAAKRNIRHLTSHKTAKKRTSHDIPGQGSLFEKPLQSAKTA